MHAVTAVTVGEGSKVQAIAGAQGGGDAVVIVGIGVEYLAFGRPFALFDGSHVFPDVCHVPTATRSVVAVSSGTKADIRNIVPIATVVTRTMTWSCEVGDFVVLVACSSQAIDELVVHGALRFFVARLNAETGQWCPFLYHQTVGGDVLDVEGKGGVDVALPVNECLVREPVHQVDADIADASVTKPLHGKRNLCGGVSSAEETQARIVEGLCTHGDAVDAESR